MTDIQKNQINRMKDTGMPYSKIAQELGLSQNTVKSYIRRCSNEPKISNLCCENCGAELIQIRAGRKRFCSDKCRNEWWNSHPDLINRKAVYDHTCQHCGKAFKAYGNARRKYCCHECYIADRFRGGSDD